jgi:hypothetical protein
MEDLFRLVRPGDQVEILSDCNEEFSCILDQSQSSAQTAAAAAFVMSKAERN